MSNTYIFAKSTTDTQASEHCWCPILTLGQAAKRHRTVVVDRLVIYVFVNV